MRQIFYITESEDCKSILKNRQSKYFDVLLISKHDPWSVKMLNQAKQWATRFPDEDKVLYVVNTYDVPEVWGVYDITVAPALMRIKSGKVSVMIEYPSIYDYFNEN